MTRDTRSWRAEVAKQPGVTILQVNKGVNVLLFGMRLLKWKRSEGIPDSTRSASLEGLEKEIKAARVSITDDEVRAGKAKSSDKSTRILSRAVERVEEELMSSLSSFLKGRGWDTSSLIHDEITIQ